MLIAIPNKYDIIGVILIIYRSGIMNLTKIHLKDLKESLQEWVKDKIILAQVIESPLIPNKLTYEDTFVLKKALVGKLEVAEHLSQILLACEFNQVRAVANIEEIFLNDEGNTYKIETNEANNKITYYLINTSRGGSFNVETS